MILDVANRAKINGNPYKGMGGLFFSATGCFAQQVIDFRNGENGAKMGCAHRAVRVALAVPALVVCSVLALAETVLRLAITVLIGIAALTTCCCLGNGLFGLTELVAWTSLTSFDISLRSIGSVFANIFTSCNEDHSFAFENIQFPCI